MIINFIIIIILIGAITKTITIHQTYNSKPLHLISHNKIHKSIPLLINRHNLINKIISIIIIRLKHNHNHFTLTKTISLLLLSKYKVIKMGLKIISSIQITIIKVKIKDKCCKLLIKSE
jgi:hypothetical protein